MLALGYMAFSATIQILLVLVLTIAVFCDFGICMGLCEFEEKSSHDKDNGSTVLVTSISASTSEGECIQGQQCDCQLEGAGVLPNNDTFVNHNCSMRCTCHDSVLNCDYFYQCSTDAKCLVNDDVRRCYCNEGYYGDGETCSPLASTSEGECIQGQQCDCQLEGAGVLPNNDTFVNHNCSMRCTCHDSVLNCDYFYQCSTDAKCLVNDDVRRCYCNEGYYGDGETCSPLASTASTAEGECMQGQQCDCNLEGAGVIPNNDTFVNHNCSMRCTCRDSVLNCDNSYQCSTDAKCLVHDDVRRCYCNEGFYGDGETCSSLASTTEGECMQGQQCDCQLEGAGVIPNNDTFVNHNCSMRCTCRDSVLNCDYFYQCSTNATCLVHDNVRRCYCNEGYLGDGETCFLYYRDCSDAFLSGERNNDIYPILPLNWPGEPFNVYCDMTTNGGGWTVFQRRIDGVTSFSKSWNHFKDGFGLLDGDFWLGNDKLHFLTKQRMYRLRIDVRTMTKEPKYAEYAEFYIEDEANKYRLTVSDNFEGNTGNNDMSHNHGSPFSTYDQDNDDCDRNNCATLSRGGWWYKEAYCGFCLCGLDCFVVVVENTCCEHYDKYITCTEFNPNGDYYGSRGESISSKGMGCHLNFTEMKIRPA